MGVDPVNRALGILPKSGMFLGLLEGNGHAVFICG